MNFSIGRMPSAIVVALGGVAQGGGIYAVSPAVAAMLRAFGGSESGGGIPANALLAEDGTPILAEDGSYILVE